MRRVIIPFAFYFFVLIINTPTALSIDKPSAILFRNKNATTIADRPITFKNDVMPVFTKSGCNAGSCHGAAVGRGGFQLSLYGSNPDADYQAIVHQLGGRRINLSQPKKSLLFAKPTEFVEHGGGTRFEARDESAHLLLNWIEQGAKFGADHHFVKLVISPKNHQFNASGESVKLKATAYFSNQTSKDVTKWTSFTPEDVSAIDVDDQTAKVTAHRRGRHIVVARFLSAVVPVELLVPMNDQRFPVQQQRLTNFIDTEILKRLETLNLPVSPLIDDAAYLRRLTLDLTGRLPSHSSLDRHLADSHPGKRKRVVKDLLSSDEFTEYWTLVLAKLLRIHVPNKEKAGALAYHRWLFEQVRKGTSFDKLVRTILLAEGDTTINGPANFYLTTNGPRQQGELFSEVLMGSRLRCANCHDHPLDRWTQDDYHGLAGIFSKIEIGKIIKTKADGEVIHPRTSEPARQRIPGVRDLPIDSITGRADLANWLTDKTNPYFARAIVNRLWRKLFGRGLVEPPDDFRSTNPATHPELLNRLAQDFINHGYDIRHTIELIVTSTTYARTAHANQYNKHDDRFYSHAIRRPLEAEVLADAISSVTGVWEPYGQQPVGTRAVALADSKTPSMTLDVLGRCGRDISCESLVDSVDSLGQTLHFFNGSILNKRIHLVDNRLGKMLKKGNTPIKIIEDFYVIALSRKPTNNEREYWMLQLEDLASTNEQRQLLEDFLWGLVNSQEFKTNH